MQYVRIVGAFLRRDWAIMRSYPFSLSFGWLGTILSLALYFSLGRFFDQSVGSVESIPDQGYFSFLIVALPLLTLTTSVLYTFSGRVQSEQTTGSLEALLATPVSPSLLIVSSGAFSIIRGVLSVALQLAIAVALFGVRFQTGAVPMLSAFAATIGCVIIFASAGLAIAGFAIVYKRPAPLIVMASSVLALLCGIYYPIDVLPRPVELLAQALPLTWAVDAQRAGLLSDSVDGVSLLLLYGTAFAVIPVSVWIFGQSLDRAKRDGSLAQY